MSIESRGQSEFDDIIFSPLTCLSSFHYDQLKVFCVLYICKKYDVFSFHVARASCHEMCDDLELIHWPHQRFILFGSMGWQRPRHCLRHWNETGEPQNPQTLVRVTDMPCGFVYWPKFVNCTSLRPEAFPIVFFAAGLLPHPPVIERRPLSTQVPRIQATRRGMLWSFFNSWV